MNQRRIVIAGCGALGSHTAVALRNECGLTLVDFDRVEQKNLLSQMYARQHVGRNKAVALAQLLDFLFSVNATAVPHRLTQDNVGELLRGADLVVDCFDNTASRRVLREYQTRTPTAPPVLHGALAGGGDFAVVAWDRHFTIDDDKGVGAPTCEDGAQLPFITRVAGYLAATAQQYLRTGAAPGITHVYARSSRAIDML